MVENCLLMFSHFRMKYTFYQLPQILPQHGKKIPHIYCGLFMLCYTLLAHYIKLSRTDIAATEAEEPVVKQATVEKL